MCKQFSMAAFSKWLRSMRAFYFAATSKTLLRQSLLLMLLLGWASAAQAAIPASERAVLTNLYASNTGASKAVNTDLGTPICTLTATPASISAGGSSTLTAICTPAATSFAWSVYTGATTVIGFPFDSTVSSGAVSPSATSTYTVTGSNASGAGNTASATVTVTVIAPGTPTNVTATAGIGSVTVAFTPGSIGSGTLVNYTASCSTESLGGFSPAVSANTTTATGMGSPITLYGLHVGATYACQVQAASTAGTSNWSLSSNSVIPFAAPPTCTLTSDPSLISAGDSSTLTASCSPAATSYAWTNTGFAGTDASGIVRPTATTTYSVTGSNASGTGNTASATVTVINITRFTLSVTQSGTGSDTVTSSPAGIDCGNTCSALFMSGISVTLTATPGQNSTFTGWSGACTGTGACTVSTNADRNVTANFNTIYTLSVTQSGTGSGTVTSSSGGIDCGSICSAHFASNASVTLTATPAPDSTFAGWSGSCTGTGACTVSMNAARNVTATFNPVPFTVVTTGVTAGVITAPVATVIATISFNPPDVGKTGSVFITAMVPGSLFAARIQTGVTRAATVPPALVQLTPSGWQQVMNGQLIPYATGVLGDQLSALAILNNTDTTNLAGSQLCVGYGANDQEMANAGRMQLVATIPDTGAANPNTGTCLPTPWSISSNQVASARDVTLQPVFIPDWKERDGNHNLYVAGLLDGQWYFVTLQNQSMNIVRWTDGEFPVYSVANGAAMPTQTWNIPLGDLSIYHGLQIYTGFGRNGDDMLNKVQYKLIYSVE